MSAPVETLRSDGTDAQALPVAMAEARILGLPASIWPRILAPLVIGVAVLALWNLLSAGTRSRITYCRGRSSSRRRWLRTGARSRARSG